jgi:predicted transcriptional regulator
MSSTKLSYKPANTIRIDRSVVDALKKMSAEDCNSLCVLDVEGRLSGIITLQDIAGGTVPIEFVENSSMGEAMYKEGFFTEQSKALANKPIKNIMRKEFITATPETNILTITADFLKNDLYNVPVIKDDQLVGVITRTDIRDALLKQMES